MGMNAEFKQVQLGSNSDPNKNFVWQSNDDFTAKLARGNIGGALTDVMLVAADGKITFVAANAIIKATMLDGAQSGSAPVFGIRAHAFVDGFLTGSNAPTAGGNISSVTRLSTGYYRCFFTVPMPNATYTADGTCAASGLPAQALVLNMGSLRTTTYFDVYTTSGWADGSVAANVKDSVFNVFVVG